jgi:hypothetical protein
VRDVRGVWAHEIGGGRLLVVVSIKQRFCGHSRQAGYIAAQCQAVVCMNRFVIAAARGPPRRTTTMRRQS